jgi:hypothetical protein
MFPPFSPYFLPYQPNTFYTPAVAENAALKLRGRYLKQRFSRDEDAHLARIVAKYGQSDWVHVAACMGSRNARQCRERWRNYLDPELRRDEWTAQEDQLLKQLFDQLGPKWNTISRHFFSRSDMALRNRHQLLVRRVTKLELGETLQDERGHAVGRRENQREPPSKLIDLFPSTDPEPDITFFTDNPTDPWGPIGF